MGFQILSLKKFFVARDTCVCFLELGPAIAAAGARFSLALGIGRAAAKAEFLSKLADVLVDLTAAQFHFDGEFGLGSAAHAIRGNHPGPVSYTHLTLPTKA